MTCVAWDGRLLAVDGQTTYSGQIVDLDTNKLHRVAHLVHGKMVAGATGPCGSFAPWIIDIGANGFSSKVEDADAAGLFVDRGGTCWEVQTNGHFERIERYSACGSGAMLAYPILRDGGSAIDAVRYAIRHSTTCGGTIRVYDPVANVIVRIK